jgi:cytochrome P450
MSWMGFGAGPRTCIGMRLAQMEDKLALVRILREYNIFECAETEVKLMQDIEFL